MHSVDHLVKDESFVGLGFCVSGVIWGLGLTGDQFNGVIEAEQSRKSVLRGALALYGAGQDKAARELIALLKREEVFHMALAEVVKEHFGITVAV